MHPLKKMEIEPLSEQRWSKIEKSLFARLDTEELVTEAPSVRPVDRSPRNWRWRPAAALVIAGAMAAAFGAIASKTLWTSSVAPAASVPSRIVTGGSDSKVALGESEVDVAPDSAVLVSGDDDRGILLVVDHGKVECEVAPRKGRPPFVVQAGEVRVRVVGTHFSVERDLQGQGAHVLVAHGIVEVSSHGKTVMLRDGESWPSPVATSAQPAPDPVPMAKVETPSVAVNPPPAVARHEGSHARGNRPAPGIARTLPDPTPTPTLAPAPSATPTPTPGLGATGSGGSATPTPSAEELYEAAARMEGQNPDGALGIYRRVASGTGPWAANALYAAGRLQADRGRKADAQRLLGEYLARYPNGANAADARDLLARMR